MAKRSKIGLTNTQHNNLMEWFQRMKEDKDISMGKAIDIFNSLTPKQKYKIVSKTWYNISTGKRINRELLPQ